MDAFLMRKNMMDGSKEKENRRNRITYTDM